MNAVIAAMITAVVGVLGTLFAPLLSQQMTTRQREAAAAAEAERRRFEERRAAYTAMNRASRQFHTLLKDTLHRLRDGVCTDQDRAQLEEARLDHRDRYAEALMIVPEAVMIASRDVNRVLAAADAAAKRIDRGRALEGETPEAVLVALKEAKPRLTEMQRVMRRDLGVED
ncbi:hypothetical protein GO001_33020 [Streptomyces sp. NRRL B-1677]|uniref:Uncharacterized protein n=1 Tax=Streptomyces klenkii TaxID=1420899 RepID=A0A3B0BS42_9ACTN|nr:MULTISPECIES: hypothetical protein [Streptomyces]MBF6049951.1 hypothetical protein [Streptomyces sp. NRRL B-1677]RKN76103.1 hypothetical protein D7231_03515 [Streptomyces klenkii]